MRQRVWDGVGEAFVFPCQRYKTRMAVFFLYSIHLREKNGTLRGFKNCRLIVIVTAKEKKEERCVFKFSRLTILLQFFTPLSSQSSCYHEDLRGEERGREGLDGESSFEANPSYSP